MKKNQPKRRYLATRIWDDFYFSNLDPSEKLLFIYLITNQRTELCGVYELPMKSVAVDTGLDKEMVIKIIERFARDKKAFYFDGWVYITNMRKHHSSENADIMQGIKNGFDRVPDRIWEQVLATDTIENHGELRENSKSDKIHGELRENDDFLQKHGELRENDTLVEKHGELRETTKEHKNDISSMGVSGSEKSDKIHGELREDTPLTVPQQTPSRPPAGHQRGTYIDSNMDIDIDIDLNNCESLRFAEFSAGDAAGVALSAKGPSSEFFTIQASQESGFPVPPKKKIKKSAKPKSESKTVNSPEAINLVITALRTKNQAIEYRHLTHRNYIDRFITSMGSIESAIELAEYAIAHQGEPYFPMVTSPSELLYKYAAVKALMVKNQTSSANVSPELQALREKQERDRQEWREKNNIK